MSLRLFMDVHVPFAITIALRLRGVDVLTAQEDNSQELEDAALLDRAFRRYRVQAGSLRSVDVWRCVWNF